MNEKLEALIRKLYGLIQPGAEMYGSASKPLTAEQAGMLGNLIADMTPVVGDVKSAYEGVQAAREGDWEGAGLGALGALPFVPNMAGAAGSIASTATRMFNNKLIDAPQFKRIAGPNARYRSEAELAALEKDMFRKYLERENPLKYVRQNP